MTKSLRDAARAIVDHDLFFDREYLTPDSDSDTKFPGVISMDQAMQIALNAIQNMPGAGPFTEEGKDDDWRFRAKLARKEALDAAQAHIMLAFEKYNKDEG